MCETSVSVMMLQTMSVETDVSMGQVSLTKIC